MTFEEAIRKLDLKHPITERRVLPFELINSLKKGVVLAAECPRSWEGARMLQLLALNGYLGDRVEVKP